MSKQIEVSETTWNKIKDIVRADDETIEIDSFDEFVGKKVFVRLVTYHLVGRVKKIVGNLVFLEDATWVADSKRFHEAVQDGFNENAELEYVGDWFFNSQSLVDGGFWKHELPKESQ